MTIDVRRAADRFVTRREGIELRHSFSFGEHYDPTNVSFRLLLASNEMLLAPGAGFDTHEHRDVEIVTWVVSGALEHADSSGAVGVIGPGMAQRLSAGRGVEHSERALASSAAAVVQMWVAPDTHQFAPSYEQRDFSPELDAGGLIAVASGDLRHESALRIHQGGATLYGVRLAAGTSVDVPAAAYVHVHVVSGIVKLPDGTTLGTGDAARMTNDSVHVTSNEEAELLIWAMTPSP